MFRKACLWAVFLFAYCIANAQDAAKDYEKLINHASPLSPNVASLGKYGEVPVNLYTGIPSIEIPVTTITSGNLSLPVSLSYHAGGIRVEETPSWVGLGWSLNAGGIITRQMRGAPDEGGTLGDAGVGGILNNAHTINQYLDSVSVHGSIDNYPEFRDLLTQAANGQADLEPDIFYYNVAGLSGKFIYDENTARFIPQSDKPVQINYSKSEDLFEIINEEGTKYQFAIPEKSRSYIYSSENAARSNYTTGWYLTRIINANNTDTIRFIYANSNLSFYTLGSGFRKTIQTYTVDVSNIPQEYAKDPFMNSFTTGFVLTGIESRSGKIVFEREATARQDLAGDTALKKIWVYDKQNNLVNSFSLDYDYFVGANPSGNAFIGGQYLKRLKLLAFNEMGKDYADSTKWKKHTFTYNESKNLPSRLSYSQDYWGYFNGKENTTLVPKAVYVASTGKAVDLPGADRYIDAASVQANILTAVTYPTGGTTTFTYESNRIPYAEMNAALPTPTKWIVEQLSALGESYLDLQDTYVKTFVVNQPPDKFINGGLGGVFVNFVINPQCGDELSSDCAGFTIDGPVDVAIPQNSNGFYLPNGTYTMTADLRPLKQRVLNEEPGFVDNGNFLFSVSYLGVDSSNLQGPDADVLVGGVRIKKMESTDPASGKSLVKTFKYVKEDGTSSGWTLSVINYSYTETLVYNIDVSTSGGGSYSETVTGDYLVRTSGSSAPMLNTQGNSTGYSRVEEYAIDNNSNGRIVHTFSHQNHFVDLDAANQYPFPPPFDAEWERGVPLSDSYEAYNSTSFVPVTQSKHEYDYWYRDTEPNTIKGIKSGFYFRSLYGELDETGLHPTAAPAPDEARNWMPYTIAAGGYWQHSDTSISYNETAAQHLTVIKEMERNPLNQKPSKITTYQSNGKVRREWIKYPVDDIYGTVLTIANRSALGVMTDRNMVSIPVFDSVTIDAVPTYLSHTAYRQDGTHVVTDAFHEAKNGNGANFWQVGKINAYDERDNMLEQQKNEDVKISYVWGYGLNYPIAKVVNAAVTDIFHTSFEDAEGNSTAGDAKTGRKSRTGGYSKALTGLTNGSYLLTWWLKSGGNWALQTNNVTVSGGSYTISVSGQVDEIRFYPAGAQMTTYTYEPLIGMTSQTDINNVPAYYEYDNFNRLLRIRDKDNNILKQYEYQYQYQPYDPTPNWQTTGATRCQTGTGSYATGHREHEEKDNNPYSSTYNTTRWIDEGLNTGACPVTADWQNTATALRCQKDGSNNNTGDQEREQRDMNPYSGTYNTTRWINAGTNTTACPLAPTIYAKLYMENQTYTMTDTYADIVIRFYSDEACTVPATVTSLVVNVMKVFNDSNGSLVVTYPSYTCTGSAVTVLSQTLVNQFITTGDPEDPFSGNTYFASNLYSLQTGSGYIVE